MADQITNGSWTAHWGDWTIQLSKKDDQWAALVRSNEPWHYDAKNNFTSVKDATTWACDKMRAHGAKVFVIDAPSMTLESLLRFFPAIETVA